MITTRTTIGAAALVITVATVGCGPAEPPPQPELRVRLLTSGFISGRWERAAEQGLGRIAAELDAEVARSRAHGSSEQRRQLRALASQRADLVFCVGGEVESIVYTEATAFPDTAFVVIPGEIHADNVASIAFMPEEAGFLAGAVAAEVTDRPRVGLLRGAGRPWLERLEHGFIAGFRTARPEAEIEIAHGPDGPWQLVAEKVDVALYATDSPSSAVLAAAHDAGVFLIGTDPELIENEPDLVIAAVEIDVAEAMLRVARERFEHRFVGRVYAFDLGSGVLDLRLNPDLDHAADLRETVERARSEITAGWVEIEELGIGR